MKKKEHSISFSSVSHCTPNKQSPNCEWCNVGFVSFVDKYLRPENTQGPSHSCLLPLDSWPMAQQPHFGGLEPWVPAVMLRADDPSLVKWRDFGPMLYSLVYSPVCGPITFICWQDSWGGPWAWLNMCCTWAVHAPQHQLCPQVCTPGWEHMVPLAHVHRGAALLLLLPDSRCRTMFVSIHSFAWMLKAFLCRPVHRIDLP